MFEVSVSFFHHCYNIINLILSIKPDIIFRIKPIMIRPLTLLLLRIIGMLLMRLKVHLNLNIKLTLTPIKVIINIFTRLHNILFRWTLYFFHLMFISYSFLWALTSFHFFEFYELDLLCCVVSVEFLYVSTGWLFCLGFLSATTFLLNLPILINLNRRMIFNRIRTLSNSRSWIMMWF